MDSNKMHKTTGAALQDQQGMPLVLASTAASMPDESAHASAPDRRIRNIAMHPTHHAPGRTSATPQGALSRHQPRRPSRQHSETEQLATTL